MAAALSAAALVLWPEPAHAQRRGRAGGARVATVVVARPAFYGYGFGYANPYWGWGNWGYPGWGAWGAPYYGPGWGFPGAASARLQVKPRNAEVYVDGYLVGTVDDFDGVFQRLDVAPGEHELTIYLEGYRPLTQKLLFRPGNTIDVKQPLEPLAPGEVTGPRPQAQHGAVPPGAPPQAGRPARGGPVPGDAAGEPAGSFGTLAVRVQPQDATVFVDGEEWTAPAGDGPILIELAEGPHELEVRKDGLPTYRRTVDVRAGRTIPLNVSLAR